MKLVTAQDILRAFTADDVLVEDVLGYLNAGMFDEWDASLTQGLEIGFGGPELQIAARAGLAKAEYDEAHNAVSIAESDQRQPIATLRWIHPTERGINT